MNKLNEINDCTTEEIHYFLEMSSNRLSNV